MPEDYAEGYPLRKDFPTEGRGWRSQFDFIPRLDEAPEEMTDGEYSGSGKETVYCAEPAAGSRRREELLLNMGPQHPSTHGVLRVVLELDGERIVKATPDLGYLHRGVEKLSEGLAYMQIIPHTDRLDYVCAMANNYAYVRAVEKLLGITVPERAEYIRTLVAEMQRIIGHLFWLGTQALDIGAMTVFFWTFREREILLDLFEQLCGARLTLNYYRIGGVDSDFTPELVLRLRAFLSTFPQKVTEYDSLIASNRIWVGRTKNVAVISGRGRDQFRPAPAPPCAAPASTTMFASSNRTASTTRWSGKCRSGNMATPTTGTGSGWKKCGRAPESSRSVWINCPRGRSWRMCRNTSRRPSNK